jgi:hypothetical protein
MYPPKFATCGILAVQRRAAGRTTMMFFFEPASLRCASSFRRARASGSVGRKQTAMRSGDSGFAFGSWRQRNSLGFPERSSDGRKPGRGVGVLEGTRFIIQHVLLHYRG